MSELGSRPKTVFAAGGIIRSLESDVPRIAVIHRPRGDWTLPKGKRDEGETLEKTALREVKEETGFDAAIGSFASTIAYEVGDRHKIVFYWHMTAKGGDFKPTKEVDALVWLTPEEALRRLTYEYDRELVAREFLGAPPLVGPGRQLWSAFTGEARRRLAAEIRAFGPELEHRVAWLRERKVKEALWVQTARELLARAEDALERSAVAEGWRCLWAARRMECFAITVGELKARCEAVRREAEQLPKRERQTIQKLLGKGEPQPMALFEAMLVRDQVREDSWHEVWAEKQRVLVLMGMLAASTVLFVAMVAGGQLSIGAAELGAKWMSVVAVAAFGMCGASLGALAAAVRGRARNLTSPAMTALRPFVGGALALLAFVLLQSELVNLGTRSGGKVFAIAFAAGLCERFVTRRRRPLRAGA